MMKSSLNESNSDFIQSKNGK